MLGRQQQDTPSLPGLQKGTLTHRLSSPSSSSHYTSLVYNSIQSQREQRRHMDLSPSEYMTVQRSTLGCIQASTSGSRPAPAPLGTTHLSSAQPYSANHLGFQAVRDLTSGHQLPSFCFSLFTFHSSFLSATLSATDKTLSSILCAPSPCSIPFPVRLSSSPSCPFSVGIRT